MEKEKSLEKKLESMERKENQIDQKNKKAEERLRSQGRLRLPKSPQP